MSRVLRKNTLHLLPSPLPVFTCGIDEAGRGPWAGPVVAAAVIFTGNIPKQLRDSKQLSQSKRELLFDEIMQNAHVGVGIQSSSQVDILGIKQVTNTAMTESIVALEVHPSLLLVDGKDAFSFSYDFFSIIKGDDLLPHISAASIIAKVTRDRIMQEYHLEFPEYGFDRHKGYGTPQHQAALSKFGPCILHRFSYRPIALLTQGH